MKKLSWLLIIFVAIMLVFTGCESDDDDDNDTTQTMSAQQMANAVSDGIVDATDEIIEITDYTDGFEPEAPGLAKGNIEVTSDPIYDSASGWWYYDTAATHTAISWTVSESLQFQDASGAPMMDPESDDVHLFLWREHYNMVQSTMEWDYHHRIEYSGVDIATVGEDFSYVDGTGEWSYDITTEEGEMDFTVHVIYNDIVLRWMDGICDEYPHSGSYTIEYGDWSAITLDFDGDSTAELTITDMDGEVWVYVVDLETGEVVLPTT